MSNEKSEKRGDVDTLSSLLESHDSGRTVADVSRDLRDAIQRARELALEEGAATVKFTVGGSITVTAKGRADVKLTTSVVQPRAAHPTTTLYTAAGGTLATSDPKQVTMAFVRKGVKAAVETTEKESE